MSAGEGPVAGSPDDRERWDRRHGLRPGEEPGAPERFVIEVLDGWERGAWRPARAPGRALDLACGLGRHALEAARRGWRVSAWDVSPVALGSVAASGARAGTPVETREVDLRAPLPGDARGAFDLVLCVNYLDRDLWTRVATLLAPGGWFALATFTDDHPAQRPGAHHRLRRGELGPGLPGWVTLRHSEAAGRAGWLGTPAGPRDGRAAGHRRSTAAERGGGSRSARSRAPGTAPREPDPNPGSGPGA